MNLSTLQNTYNKYNVEYGKASYIFSYRGLISEITTIGEYFDDVYENIDRLLGVLESLEFTITLVKPRKPKEESYGIDRTFYECVKKNMVIIIELGKVSYVNGKLGAYNNIMIDDLIDILI